MTKRVPTKTIEKVSIVKSGGPKESSVIGLFNEKDMDMNTAPNNTVSDDVIYKKITDVKLTYLPPLMPGGPGHKERLSFNAKKIDYTYSESYVDPSDFKRVKTKGGWTFYYGTYKAKPSGFKEFTEEVRNIVVGKAPKHRKRETIEAVEVQIIFEDKTFYKNIFDFDEYEYFALSKAARNMMPKDLYMPWFCVAVDPSEMEVPF